VLLLLLLLLLVVVLLFVAAFGHDDRRFVGIVFGVVAGLRDYAAV
jgi:hypothetical protein